VRTKLFHLVVSVFFLVIFVEKALPWTFIVLRHSTVLTFTFCWRH